ncbi:esterase FE4-like [Eupeodes corollae]|uniref:esterase FE4-like n=1 Tax=Eupeodes corollae TaxID=290404 RepID=UPI002492C5FE|nr:esterase FE4-like [Eupeodes corollae]
MGFSTNKVKVKQGTVIGGEDVLPNGNRYYYFRGVPYAVPPLGTLRFKAPVPLEKFSTPELNCISEGPMSIQQDRVTGKLYAGSEDCLYLNVYTPKTDSKAPLPVMVYLHGGGFITGNGNSDKHNPLYLLQEGTIVVTSNYRLGVLGFLSLPEAGIPGNAGLKDQVLVMKWVKENISQFNGDPDNITICGHSTGSSCVHIHLFSDISKGLYHKGIMQSGVFNMDGMLYSDEPSKNGWRTKYLAHLVGCNSNDPHEILKFLQNFNNLEEFVNPMVKSGSPHMNELMPIRPVIEEQSPEAVITRKLFQAMSELNYVQVPLLMGYTNAEGLGYISRYGENLKDFHNDFSQFIPESVKLILDNSERIELANSIRKFYFQESKVDDKTIYPLVDLISDYMFISNIREAAELHTKFQHKSPLYFYRFDFDGQLNLYKRKFKVDHLKGASHVDELSYVFQMEFGPPEPWEEDAHKMVRTMCKMWGNFCKYSNPTPIVDDEFNGCVWEPVEKVNDWEHLKIKVLIFDKELKMLENPDEERMTFWKNLKNNHK